MRLFVGIDLSPILKLEILNLQKSMRPYFQSGGWKTEDMFHITLKFLGEVPETNLLEVQEAMRNAALNYRSSAGQHFDLTIDRLDYFGLGQVKTNGNRPVRVLWLGLSCHNVEPLNCLQQQIENAFETIGFKRDNRPYTPHITLAQDTTMLPTFDDITWKYKIDSEIAHIPIVAEKLTLFLSERNEDKRMYRPIFEVEL